MLWMPTVFLCSYLQREWWFISLFFLYLLIYFPFISLTMTRYYLNCSSCHWNSLSIGMTADNPYNIKRETDKTQQVPLLFLSLYWYLTRVCSKNLQEFLSWFKEKQGTRQPWRTRIALSAAEFLHALSCPPLPVLGASLRPSMPESPYHLRMLRRPWRTRRRSYLLRRILLKNLNQFPIIATTQKTLIKVLWYLLQLQITDSLLVSTIQQRLSHLQAQSPFIKYVLFRISGATLLFLLQLLPFF